MQKFNNLFNYKNLNFTCVNYELLWSELKKKELTVETVKILRWDQYIASLQPPPLNSVKQNSDFFVRGYK